LPPSKQDLRNLLDQNIKEVNDTGYAVVRKTFIDQAGGKIFGAYALSQICLDRIKEDGYFPPVIGAFLDDENLPRFGKRCF
jgi:hypothetical protein